MARAFEEGDRRVQLFGEVERPLRLHQGVVSALEDEHRAANARAQRGGRLRVELLRVPAAETRQDRLGVGLQSPLDAILDRLCRVRLGEALREEVLEIALPVPEPVVAVLLRPAFVGVEDVVKREADFSTSSARLAAR